MQNGLKKENKIADCGLRIADLKRDCFAALAMTKERERNFGFSHPASLVELRRAGREHRELKEKVKRYKLKKLWKAELIT